MISKKAQKYIDEYSKTMISEEILKKKSTQRLLNIFRNARSDERNAAGNISDNYCTEGCNCGFTGTEDEWENDIKPVIEFFEKRSKLIKSILDGRENIK